MSMAAHNPGVKVAPVGASAISDKAGGTHHKPVSQGRDGARSVSGAATGSQDKQAEMGGDIGLDGSAR